MDSIRVPVSSRAHIRLLAFINVFLLTVWFVLFAASPDVYTFSSGVSVLIIHIDFFSCPVFTVHIGTVILHLF